MVSGANTGIGHGTAEFMLHPFRKKKKKWLVTTGHTPDYKECRQMMPRDLVNAIERRYTLDSMHYLSTDLSSPCCVKATTVQ